MAAKFYGNIFLLQQDLPLILHYALYFHSYSSTMEATLNKIFSAINLDILQINKDIEAVTVCKLITTKKEHEADVKRILLKIKDPKAKKFA